MTRTSPAIARSGPSMTRQPTFMSAADIGADEARVKPASLLALARHAHDRSGEAQEREDHDHRAILARRLGEAGVHDANAADDRRHAHREVRDHIEAREKAGAPAVIGDRKSTS